MSQALGWSIGAGGLFLCKNHEQPRTRNRREMPAAEDYGSMKIRNVAPCCGG
jgi:hypothetical protein